MFIVDPSFMAGGKGLLFIQHTCITAVIQGADNTVLEQNLARET